MPGTLLLVNPSPPRRRLFGGTASAMYGRPVRQSLHRPSRPRVSVAEVGVKKSKRATPKKKPAAKKAAKRSSKMTARKMSRRPARRNPMDRAPSGPGAGQYYRMVRDGKTGKMVRKYYGPGTTAKVLKKATSKRGMRAKDGTIKVPSDRQVDLAFSQMYLGRKPRKKVAAKKRKSPAKRKPAAKRSSGASASAKLRAQAKRMGLKSSGTMSQVQARIKAKQRRMAAKKGKAPAKRRAAPAKRRAAPAKRRAASRRRAPSMTQLDKRIRNARSLVRRSTAKRSPTRRIHQARGSALRLQKAARKGQLSKRQKMLLRRHGLMRVNPSLKGITEDFLGLLPKAGVTVLATAGVAWGGQKIGQRLQAMQWMPEAVKPFAVPVATGGVTIGAFYAASMIRPLAKFRDAIMFGGLAAVAVHTLAAIRVKKGEEEGVTQSLGQKLGLPIGEFVAIGDYIPQSLGRHYGEQLGEFVALGAAPNPYLNVDGSEVRLNGYGENPYPRYGIFSEASRFAETGDFSAPSQMGYGREPARALDSAGDETVEEVLAEDDAGGVLSGSVFG